MCLLAGLTSYRLHVESIDFLSKASSRLHISCVCKHVRYHKDWLTKLGDLLVKDIRSWPPERSLDDSSIFDVLVSQYDIPLSSLACCFNLVPSGLSATFHR